MGSWRTGPRCGTCSGWARPAGDNRARRRGRGRGRRAVGGLALAGSQRLSRRKFELSAQKAARQGTKRHRETKNAPRNSRAGAPRGASGTDGPPAAGRFDHHRAIGPGGTSANRVTDRRARARPPPGTAAGRDGRPPGGTGDRRAGRATAGRDGRPSGGAGVSCWRGRARLAAGDPGRRAGGTRRRQPASGATAAPGPAPAS